MAVHAQSAEKHFHLAQDEPSTSQLLAQGAAAAGLSATLAPFSAEGSWEQRLAANPYLMAPMAGVSDQAYRLMARAGGAACAVSEMVSVAGIHYANEKTWQLVDPNPAEPDLIVQLFGSDPEQFYEATKRVIDRYESKGQLHKLVAIDINMACPVPKVVRKGEGSALLDDPARAADIVRSVREGSDYSLPVTAKIRIGRKQHDYVAPAFAQALERAGVSSVAVHGRYANQFYTGTSDANAIARVVRAVDIPVIASGDALTAAQAVQLKESTDAAAVFCARGTYGNPWIFADARALAAGHTPAPHATAQRLAAFALHVQLLSATGAHIARARSLAGWYLKGMPEAASWRERAMHCVGVSDYLHLIAQVAQANSLDPASVLVGDALQLAQEASVTPGAEKHSHHA